METKTNRITRLGIVAALYSAMTIVFSFISYGQIQVRLSEILILLVFFRKDYAISIVLGNVIANCFSPLGIYDVILGSFATLVSCLAIMLMKNLFVSIIYPVIFNGLFIGFELYFIEGLPFFVSFIYIAIGELIAMIIGYIIINRYKDNKLFLTIIKANNNRKDF